MAAPLRLSRGVGAFWRALQPPLRRPPPPPRRAGSSGARSRLYEYAREGWASWPQLDVAGLSERDLEVRKGPLKAPDLREIVTAWERLNQVQEEIAKLTAEKNRVRKEVHNFTQSHDESTLQTLPVYNALVKEGREIRFRLKALRQEEVELQEKYYLHALKLPNRIHPDVQLGDEIEPRVLEIIGRKPEFDFKVKGHLEIGEDLDIIRQRRLAHISGLRSYYLRGAGALLERALGFIPMSVPDLVKGAVFVSISPVVCSSTCYRAETETGKEPWGLYRVHQFTKISSLSNCTDFQSRRLNIMYYDEKQQHSFAHTPLMGAEVIHKPSHTLLKYIGPNQAKKGKKPVSEKPWKT
ncbi:hypothetical protein E2320_000795 [Naja naja]|nr:hypothetical protein E2320_000795 [Naja naja]